MSCCVTLNICLSALYDDFYKTHTANTPGEKNVSHLAGVLFFKRGAVTRFVSLIFCTELFASLIPKQSTQINSLICRTLLENLTDNAIA